MLIYGSIGVFGAIGIATLTAVKPSTVLDFFDPKTDISALIVELLFLIHLITAFPIFCFVSRL
jgi:sodium-coupled neutral amino acid transporter 9